MNGSGTRIDAVMRHVNTGIAARTWPAGARLPSVRSQARSLKVSVSTVVEAYERLCAEGVLISRPGSGFYVAGPAAPLALAAVAPKVDRAIDPLWVSRQALEAEAGLLKPGCGWLPPGWLYEAGVRRALRAVARSDTLELAEYATPLGHPGLRQFLSRRLSGAGVEAPPEQILLAESGTQAIDLICRFLLQPGDTVLVDDPCYFNFHALLKAHRVTVIGVPYTPSGPDLEAFASALRDHAPRLYITNSGVHNPTGAALSPVIAHRLLKLAEAHELVIVEDDIFADFEVTAAPRLCAFDGLTRVIHIGSFSKTVSASVRCGYVAARGDWIDSLVDLKIATNFGGGRLAAELILRVLTDSGYRRHMEAVRSSLADQRLRVAARLAPMGITPWIVPQAGIFLWCKLPGGIDAAELAQVCLKQGVVLAPGNVFSQSQSQQGFMRFNVAQMEDERVFEVLKVALQAR